MNNQFKLADILLVEDNAGDIELTKEAFEEAKFRNNLHVATDGEKALDFLYKRNEYEDSPTPDIILLDLNLPKTDGREVLEDIKNDKDLRRIPTIILTSSSADKDIIETYDLHANCYIVKPVDAVKFMDVVQRVENFWVDSFLLENLEMNIVKAKRWKKQIALMFIDIYKFKEINDNLGHENGNHVIKEVGERIRSSLRDSDFIARYGGDEFAIILDLENCCLRMGCTKVACKIIRKMSHPINIGNNNFVAPVNIGFSLYPYHGQKAKDIIQAADMAMYQSKKIGPNTYKFA